MEIKCIKVSELNKDILEKFNNCFKSNDIKFIGKYMQYLFLINENKVYCFDMKKNQFVKGKYFSNWIENTITFQFTDSLNSIVFEDFNGNKIFTNSSSEIVDMIFEYDYLKKRNPYRCNSNCNSNKCISNELWQSQSSYKYGLSIIYKNDNGSELYGIADSLYNIVFDYDKNVSKINILNNKLLLIEKKDGLSSLYDINNGYLFDFKKINSVVILDDGIYKIKVGEKYQLFINGKLINDEYDDITFDRNVLIIEKSDEVLFYDLNLNLLYKTSNKDFSKSRDCIYYKKDNNYIEHNLFNSNEIVIGRKIFKNSDGSLIKIASLKKILSKYKYYYDDMSEGEIYLFADEMYGISVKFDDVCAIKWFKDIDSIKNTKRNIANAILNLSTLDEFDLDKKMIIQSGGQVGV